MFIVSVILFTTAAAQWLPKCCPPGKQIASDGKSCVEDPAVSFAYNVTDSNFTDTLTVSTDRGNVSYRLEHRGKFSCVRHEVFVVQDDVAATAGGGVAVTDDRGHVWALAPGEACVDSVRLPGLVPERVHVALLCPDCRRVPCLHKCCPEGEDLQVSDDGGQVDCVPSDTSWTDAIVQDSQARPFLVHGFPTCANQLYLDYVDSWDVEAEHLRAGPLAVPRAQYCVDRTPRGPALLACRLPSLRPTVYGGLFVLGAVFLAATFALHLWLPELRRSLHSRVLVAHVACLLVGYVGLATVHLATLPAPSPACSAAAFTIQFSVLAAMFWLNVMCVDIAWTFSGLRAPKGSNSLDSDGHKFVYYSLFAWGGSAAISGLTAFLEFSPAIPVTSKLKPSFGSTKCWFQHWESILLLVYGPMGLLLAANMALFVYTAVKIRRTQRDTANIVQHAGSKLRQDTNRFSLYLKLFGLMGVTWIFDVISWSIGGPESYWYITDTINALRGVFIFILFCCKEKVLVLIKAKLHIGKTPKFPMRPRKSQTSSKMTSSLTSQRTNSIQLSQVS